MFLQVAFIDNGMIVKTDSGCSLIEYDIYFKESEYQERLQN